MFNPELGRSLDSCYYKHGHYLKRNRRADRKIAREEGVAGAEWLVSESPHDYQSCNERQPGLETFMPALKREGMIFP